MDEIRPVTMTGKEAAKYLGISYWLVLELAKRKEIPAIHAGARVLFRQETLDIWMHNQEMQSMKSQVPEQQQQGVLRRAQA